ncbi:FAD-binding protein [Prauserella sp. PE36]|uniref:FAD-binding protein n=1 Tax=Prauserella sp. PE36 TaxID=1504709 RepID=UPI001313E00B|nr:FAD-binding protein [Prauserella sp. PE36]
MSGVREVDLLCVGGGLGGLAAALRAHELGAEVLVAERSSLVGGVAAYSGGFVWVGGDPLSSSAADPIEAVESYLDHVQGERPVDRAARREYLLDAVEATAWFADAGVPLRVIPDAPDLYHPAPGSTSEGRLLECVLDGAELGAWRPRLRPGPYYDIGVTRAERYTEPATPDGAAPAEDRLTHGVGLAGGFVRETLVRRGVECLLGHRAVELLREDGAVVGAVLDGPGGRVAVRARGGVLIAAGGYGWTSHAAELEDVPELVECAPPVVEGDSATLAEQAGAGLVRGADPFFSVGYGFPGEVHPGTDVPLVRPLLAHLGLPHSMIVNRDGRRFGDESYYGALIGALRRFDGRRRRWANLPCWFLVDDEYRKRYPLGPYAAGQEWPHSIPRADSLAELAALTGIDPDGLERTVTAFNEGADRGEDPEFGRGTLPFVLRTYGDAAHEPNGCLGALRTPPFYALDLTVVGFGMGTLGLWIDRHARVLRRDGTPIPGLYATGNAAATRELRGYVTGLANARNYTYAYRAAGHACGRVRGTHE